MVEQDISEAISMAQQYRIENADSFSNQGRHINGEHGNEEIPIQYKF